MPRPRKCRRVCCLPKSNMFGPINASNKEHGTLIMSVDEYETIRLIDLEGMTQEECASKMDVARTTIQKIYNDARLKLAKSLVNGEIIKIEGGDYQLCEDSFGYKRCQKQSCCRIPL